MKTQEEIEHLAEKHYTQITLSQRTAFKLGYSQCQKDMANEIQSLIDGYKSDILLLEEEFRDSSSVLTVEKIVTLTRVITDLEKLI